MTQTGTRTNTAVVDADQDDPNAADNQASATTIVGAAQANLGLTKTASSDAVARGGIVSYTLRITNQGAQDATGVTLSDPLPAGAELLGITPSQGSCQPGPPIACALGTVANGASATVTIDVRATQEGALTNVADVSGTLNDPNIANNRAMAVTTVGPPAVAPEPRDCRVHATPHSLVAGRRTTVRMTAELLAPREPQGDVLVRLKGPGIAMSVRTGTSGSVRVAIRPARAGTLRITAPELGSCSVSIRVKPKPRSGTAGGGTGAGLTGRPN
ncbi:MAG: DUF11 domain-containing protein [Actinobacteria bacterium]|nr:DUF11 domain-containing protein [Actinomycetota bacterium]